MNDDHKESVLFPHDNGEKRQDVVRKPWISPKIECITLSTVESANNANAYEQTGGVWQVGS